MHALKHNWPFFLLLLVCNVAFIAVCLPYGIGLSVDSANYVSAAESLVKHHELRMFDAELLVNAPPLLPLLLWVPAAIGIPAESFALFFNAILMNASLLLGFKLLREAKSDLPAYALLLALLPYWAFEHGFIQLLSEPLFICLLLWYQSVLLKPRSNGLYSGILLAALCSLRYAAYLMIPGFLVFMLLQQKSLRWLFLHHLPVVLVSVIWLLRNYIVSDTLWGQHTIMQKYQPVLLFGFLLIWIVLLIYIITKKQTISGQRQSVILCLLLPVTSYLILLFLQQNLPYTQIPRFVSIAEIPLFMSMVLILSARTDALRWLKGLLVLLMCIKLVLFYRKCSNLQHNGAGGFHSRAWQNPAILQALRAKSLGGYCSNFPDIVYWVSREPCSYMPFWSEPCDVFKARIGNRRKLIWFHSNSRNHVMQEEAENSRCFAIAWEQENLYFSCGIIQFLNSK